MQSCMASKLGNIGPKPRMIKKTYGVLVPSDGTVLRDFEVAYYKLQQRVFLGRYKGDGSFYRVRVLEVMLETDQVC
jgi:hypothetical protein